MVEAVTPAETPKECEYCFGNGPVSADHAHELHADNAEKDARIRELEGLLHRWVAWYGENCFGSNRYTNEDSKAALARSEGGT